MRKRDEDIEKEWDTHNRKVQKQNDKISPTT